MATTSLERPDEHEVGAAGEVYCWLNSDRECNAACTAFDQRSRGSDDINPCMILNNVRSVAVSLGRYTNSRTTAPSPPPPPSPTGAR